MILCRALANREGGLLQEIPGKMSLERGCWREPSAMAPVDQAAGVCCLFLSSVRKSRTLPSFGFLISPVASGVTHHRTEIQARRDAGDLTPKILLQIRSSMVPWRTEADTLSSTIMLLFPVPDCGPLTPLLFVLRSAASRKVWKCPYKLCKLVCIGQRGKGKPKEAERPAQICMALSWDPERKFRII